MSRVDEVKARQRHTADAGWPPADEAAEYRDLSLTLAAEVDALRSKIARVKAESLRVMADGEVIWCYEMGGRRLGRTITSDQRVMIHDPIYKNWYSTTGSEMDTMMAFRVQPVRLVRWEGE